MGVPGPTTRGERRQWRWKCRCSKKLRLILDVFFAGHPYVDLYYQGRKDVDQIKIRLRIQIRITNVHFQRVPRMIDNLWIALPRGSTVHVWHQHSLSWDVNFSFCSQIKVCKSSVVHGGVQDSTECATIVGRLAGPSVNIINLHLLLNVTGLSVGRSVDRFVNNLNLH